MASTCPDREYLFRLGDTLYVIEHDEDRPNLKIGQRLVVDVDHRADEDDEVSVDVYGFVKRTCVSVVPNIPTSLDPSDLREWLDQ